MISLFCGVFVDVVVVDLKLPIVGAIDKCRADNGEGRCEIPQRSTPFSTPTIPPATQASCFATKSLPQWAISELLFVSVSKWVLVLNYCKGNEFDLHKNMQLISIWMVVHQDSLWNWGMQQLGNGLLKDYS